ncbi:MAG TPA: penicillin-binding transpeptidase domain-containing protein [Terriglobia bacterium]|nr:penicillin-binding transpeptidase domain-containing protein [Terriglobia bacterium]
MKSPKAGARVGGVFGAILRRGLTVFLKKATILALAVSWLLVGGALFRAVASTTSAKRRSAHSLSHRRLARTTKYHRTRHTRHYRRRRLARAWSPWNVSSFGDSTAGDSSYGEDPAIRQAAIAALGNLNGSVVVADPNTGRILSIVNQKLALTGAFIPCSTIKPIVALGALREGIVSERTKLRVYGRSRVDLTEALAHSNNAYFAKLGEMLGFGRVTHYAREFGLGEKAGWDIPEESAGAYPAVPPKVGGVGLLTSFGQDIEVTPLEMAAVLSAIANGGTLYYLQYPRSPEEQALFQPRVKRRLTELAPYLPQLRDGLAAAVLYGTARRAYDPAEQIFGKTGTCSEDGARLGWFDSYSAEGKPQYVVVVLLRGGRPMFGPHAAEIAGTFYRDLVEKQKQGTEASRTVSGLGR